MAHYQVEARLRVIHERGTARAFFTVAILFFVLRDQLFVVPHLGLALVAAIALRGVYWHREARTLERYQSNLYHSRPFALRSDKLPTTSKRLYIGHGFEWWQIHTQRLNDLQEHPEFGRPPRFYRWLREFESRHVDTKALAFLIAFTSAQRWWNPVRPFPDLGGTPTLHGVGADEQSPVFLDQEIRNNHLLVIGTTRVGKTRFLELLARQDIRSGHVVVVIDPKGDADLLRNLYAEAIRCGRADRFYLFHLGFPDISARYNPIGEIQRITEIPSRVTANLPGDGQSLAFREFVWRYTNAIGQALVALGQRADYASIKRYGEDIEPLVVRYLEDFLSKHPDYAKRWRRDVSLIESRNGQAKNRPRNPIDERTPRVLALRDYFRRNDIIDSVAHSLLKTIEYERSYLDKLVGSLLPLMEKLCTGKMAELLSPDYTNWEDERPILNWSEVFRTGGVVYVGLDALSDPEVASVVGGAMLSDMTATAGSILKRGLDTGLPVRGRAFKICGHFDELAELIGDSFVPLANKAGGADICINAYTQVKADLPVKLDSELKAEQVVGNMNSKVFFRVAEPKTAELCTDSLRKVRVKVGTDVSGATDSSDPTDGVAFGSNHQRRLTNEASDLVDSSDLMRLPKGEAFASLDGGRFYKIRVPLVAGYDDVDLPEDVEGMAASMASSYRTSTDWYTFTDSTLPAMEVAYPAMAA